MKSEISKEILEKQKEVFGFSLFILHQSNVYETIKLGIQNSKNVIERQKSILQIPHTYIFGGLFLGFILRLFQCVFLFLPIILGLLAWNCLSIFKIVNEKVNLFKKSRIFFDLSLEDAKKINDDFFIIQPFEKKSQIWTTNTGQKIDGNTFGMKTFLYLFAQPFIFGHLHFFGGIPFEILFIYDFLIFLILYGWYEKIILSFLLVWYNLYFFLLDTFPSLFSREDKQRDFFMDLYKLGNKNINNIQFLLEESKNFKNGIIEKNLGKGLSSSVLGIYKIFELVKKNEVYLQDKAIFHLFIKNLINEMIEQYMSIFDILEEKINTLQNNQEIQNLNSSQKAFIQKIVNENLKNKSNELMDLKNKMYDLKIE